MPAETHNRSDPCTSADVMTLLESLFDTDLGGDESLADLGVVDEIDVIAIWEAAVEEFGERGIGDPDLGHLETATNVDTLARAIATSIGTSAETC